jgi:2-polyprenyl-6-methoxyphenol hydroxylase-like FAD-dependent oxidoreductase
VSGVDDVIVVGAGPVGATAALLLAAHGVDCTVLERRNHPRTHPAAHVLSTRSMEIWREIGLERDIRRLSAPTYDLRTIVYATTLTGPELGRVALMDLPEAQLDAIESISPTRACHLPQNVLEPLLWKRLSRCERVDFRAGATYVGYDEDSHGITVTVADGGTGATYRMRGRYLIGADGAGSAVRTAMGVAINGPLLQHMVSIHFAADLDAFVRHRRGPVVWTHTTKGIGTFIMHRPPDDLVFQIPYFPPVQSLADFPADVCRRHIIDAIGHPHASVDIKSIQSWAMTAQIAATYRVGRAFLAGDAAHRFPPTGGLGLNAGIADVHNLAWKLAWVLSTRADDVLLNSYELERRPVGVHATADSVANFDGLLDVLAALGLPRRVTRRLPTISAALPRWVPRRLARKGLGGLTSLGYQPLRVAASAGWLGRKIRERAAAVIAEQGPHYRSWGRDLGVCYRDGAIVADALAAPVTDAQFYVPRVRAGGRLPHAWTDGGNQRLSTLDLIDRDKLTLLASVSAWAAWSKAAADMPVSVQVISESQAGVWSTGVAGADPDALLVRPDGHIATMLYSGADPGTTTTLRHAIEAVTLGSLAPESQTA